MSLLFYDGFDHYDQNSFLQKWTSNAGLSTGGTIFISPLFGRVGGRGMRLMCQPGGGNTSGASVYKTHVNRSTLVMGCAFYVESYQFLVGTGALIALMDVGTTQVDVRIDGTQRLYVTRNGTTLFTTTPGLSYGSWYFIELKATIHGSAGYVELRLNGAVLGTFSGNTSGSGNAYANRLQIGFVTSFGGNPGGTNSVWIDDLYLLEADSAAGLVDFLGDCRVQTLLPNAVGTTSNMTRTLPAALLKSQDAPVTVVDTISGIGLYVTDGNVATQWRSSTDVTASAWFYIDMGTAIQIDAFTLTQITNVSGAWSRQFRIESSPDTFTWTTVFLSASNLAGTEYQTLTALTTPGSARYWRFTSVAGSSSQDWVIADASLYQNVVTPSNWLAVADPIPDYAASSVAANTAGIYDTYQYSDLTAATNRVFAVSQSFFWQKDDAGFRTATARVRSGGSEADFATPITPLTASYSLQQQIQEVNPVTGVAWTVSEVNNAEFGPKVAS